MKMHPIYRCLLFILICFLNSQFVSAQMTVIAANNPSAPFTPQSLAQNVFLGQGVQVVSINYIGDNRSVGFFQNANSLIGINEGIILSSGQVIDALGPNGGAGTGIGTTGIADPDLTSIAGIGTNDVAGYVIEFIPSTDSLEFQYVFASDEYSDFVNNINDAFGFFIDGPGLSGPFSNNATNIALVPGTTTPVSINTINNGGNGLPPTNSQFFIDNDFDY